MAVRRGNYDQILLLHVQDRAAEEINLATPEYLDTKINGQDEILDYLKTTFQFILPNEGMSSKDLLKCLLNMTKCAKHEHFSSTMVGLSIFCTIDQALQTDIQTLLEGFNVNFH